MSARISWTCPEPRQGFVGGFDKFVGPGATTAEIVIGLGGSIVAPVAVVLYAFLNHLGWSLIQYVVIALLASDIVGGLAVDATSTAKRWYHREGQGPRQLLGKVAIHLIHIFLVAWLFRGLDLVYFAVVSGYLAAATFLVFAVPLYLRRASSVLLVCGAILMNLYVFPMTPGLEWFIPMLFIGLVGCFIVREEPYRPSWECEPAPPNADHAAVEA